MTIEECIQSISKYLTLKRGRLVKAKKPMLDLELEYYGPVNDLPHGIPDKYKEVNRIIRRGYCTIVRWGDGTSTMVTLADGDADDPYVAFLAALGKKVYGSNSAIKSIVRRKTRQ